MNETGRKAFLTAYQNRKKEQIQHPFLGERLPWGLVPYVQGPIAGTGGLRGDLDAYPPFLWK